MLVGGGLAAGIVNTLAGAGSLLTVPLLVLVGLPGNFANGTNTYDTGVISANVAAGDTLTLQLTTATAGDAAEVVEAGQRVHHRVQVGRNGQT